ncbi:MAG: glycosyltransferase family 4 protein [Bacteroidales bacterium]|nr:glycosyltransferase family 4 protein [Bacteroidales bacterium]
MTNKGTKPIAIFTTSNFPYGGAAENFVRQMVYGLNSAGAKTEVILMRGHHIDTKDTLEKQDYSYLLFKKRPKYEFIKLVELILIVILIPFSLVKLKVKKKCSIVILYGIEYFYYVIPFKIVGSLLGIKIYRVITDRYNVNVISPRWWKRSKIFFYNIQYRYFDRLLNGIVCLSSYLKNSAIKGGVLPDRILIIPHFIDLSSFATAANTTPFSKPTFRLGMCGTLTKENGLYILVDAFLKLKEQNREIELLLIGPMSETDMNIIEKRVERFKNSIIFTGRVPSTEVANLILSCDILINPRVSGVFAEAGFPTKLGEYMATKRPVVTTAVGDIKHYFTHKKEVLIVQPDSYQAIMDGVVYLLKNKDKAIEVGKNGYDWAFEHLDFINNGKKLLNFITK